MNYKKAILKKYTGKGGIISDTISEIPNTIGNAYNNVKNRVQSGITNGIVKFVGDTPAGRILKSGLASQKQGILKNAISEAKPKMTPPGTAISGAAKAIARPITPITPVKPKTPKGWDSVTYKNFKKANPKLEPDAEDTQRMLNAK